MRQDKKLTIGMAIFTLIVFVSFGVIITIEKASPYLIPKIDKKLTTYIQENYKEEDLILKETEYKKTKFQKEVISKENKHLSFKVYYQNKKITDTYKKDYLKGNDFLKYISKKIETEIAKKTSKTYKITIPTTLDQFTTTVRKKMLEEKNLSNLKIYNLESEITVKKWTQTEISNKIIELVQTLEENNITPKTYTIIITDKNDITNSVEIKNFTTKIIENNELDLLINGILNNEKSNIKEKNVTYKYLN